MRSALFDFPRSATFGRVLPKSKIYEYAHPPASVKKLFVRQIDQIVWQYKLAPETLKLPATPAVSEIQVFRISLKEDAVNPEVLRSIDMAIASPLIFELLFENRCKVKAAFKRSNESDPSKRVVSEYIESDWLPQDTQRSLLPVALDLGMLYEQLLAPMIPFTARAGERLGQRLERVTLIRAKQREVERCQAQLQKEKQFNRKVEINAELRILKQELEALSL
jgi:hypothetical protein